MSLQKIFVLNHDGTISIVLPNGETLIVKPEELLPIARKLIKLQEGSSSSATVLLCNRKFTIVNDTLNIKAYFGEDFWFDIDDSNVLIDFMSDPNLISHEKI